MPRAERPRERAVRGLRDLIAAGSFRSGADLPSEHELARRLGVSRDSLRRALTALEAEGLLERPAARRRRVSAAAADPTAADLAAGTVLVVGEHAGPQAWQRGTRLHDAGFHAALETLRAAGRPVHLLAQAQASVAHVVRLMARRPAGLLVLCPEVSDADGHPALAALPALCQRQGLPVVALGDESGWDSCDRLDHDHAAGCAALVRRLAGRGCRRIAQVGFRAILRTTWWRLRREGYRRGCAEAGLAALPLCVPEDAHWDPGQDRPDRLALCVGRLRAGLAPLLLSDPRPDALLLPSDGEAGLAGLALRAAGLEPGRDLLLAGYDGVFADTRLAEAGCPAPALSIDKDMPGIGRAAAALLLDAIAGRLDGPPRLRLLPGRLLES